MTIQIAEIQTGPTPGPANPAFHRNALMRQMILPRGQLAERDRERQMQRPSPMMRRNNPARPRRRLPGGDHPNSESEIYEICFTVR